MQVCICVKARTLADLCLSVSSWTVFSIVYKAFASILPLNLYIWVCVCVFSCSRPASLQSVCSVKPQKLLPWSAAPAEPPSTDSPFTATGQRKYIPKTTQVSSKRGAHTNACALCTLTMKERTVAWKLRNTDTSVCISSVMTVKVKKGYVGQLPRKWDKNTLTGKWPQNWWQAWNQISSSTCYYSKSTHWNNS